MPLFQKSVLKKHLLDLNIPEIDAAYSRFTAYFHNAVVQQNIRNAKEEQFQEGFLRELFGTVLNYTLNPNPNFNLTTELKNTTNSKKADGAILVDEKAVAVIELKGTDTTDLNKIETQAFGYKNNQAECNYVITSNFEKLRFYIDNTIDFEEFNLFTLTRDQFSLLYLCLSYDNIKNNVPKRLKAESVSQEDQITKKLYKDYSEFKRALFNNLVELNPQYDKLLLFKKTQKLLDRFLFIFFAEDTLLLPTNLIFRINAEWKNLQAMRIPVSLYERYRVYFNDLNHGAKVTLPAFGKKTGEAITAEFEIFAYNGGLFLPDEVLDNVKIDDTLLHTYSEKLSHYDFDSDVDVNILGHIFENSLNEIDEIKSEIEGTAVDKTKTKRKKDGVFYTPKYITKYIVDNTVGKLCTEKKAELKLVDEDYTSDKKLQTKTKKALLDKLAEYRAWLLQLTICDPACGSGAFLNQALEFLIAEHRYVDELQAKLMGDALILSDIETSILENNIYGVDLNDESVEIAKLSLWLRTAQKGRKLNSLNKNIKCGNSLIDDPAVAGDKAFTWEKEFPDIFPPLEGDQGGGQSQKRGFDVVIGNPPYVLCQPSNTNEELLQYYKSFKVASYKIDLFHLFFEKSIDLISDIGKLGFITPNTYLSNKYIFPLRNYILENTNIVCLVNHEESVFADANVDVATIVLSKPKSELNEIVIFKTQNGNFIFDKITLQDEWETDENKIFNLKTTFSFQFKGCIQLGEIFHTYFGIQAFDRTSSISNQKISEDYLPIVDGGEIIPYTYSKPTKYFNYKNENIKSGGDWNVYNKERILVRQIGQTPVVGLSEKGLLASNTLYSLYPKNEDYNLYYVLGILNSNLLKKYWLSKYSDGKLLFPKIKGYQLKELPIKILDQEKQDSFVKVVFSMVDLNSDLWKLSNNFISYLKNQKLFENITSKLQNWHELTFPDFIKELNKAIKASGGTPLSKKDEFEWMELFEENKQKALELKAQIDQTDKEIDQMVYELYGLTEEEIRIVEGKIN